jgi:hypothetical protein
VEGLSFVTPVTGLNRPNTGKEDDDDDDVFIFCRSGIQTMRWVTLTVQLEVRSPGQNVTSFS